MATPSHSYECPARPSRIDLAIAEAHGSTVALDTSNEALQTLKTMPTPSLKEMIEQKTRENGRLREELAYLGNMRRIGDGLAGEVDYVLEKLRFALITYKKEKERIESEK